MITESEEINGDQKLSLSRRWLYILSNFIRNSSFQKTYIRREQFFADRQERTSPLASPGRVLTEAYLTRKLPELLPPGPIRVLDIGCGSGRTVHLLSSLGYSGEYVGLDVQNKFQFGEVEGFQKVFIQGDAHDFNPDGKPFDLILSISALEHIPNDARLIHRLPTMLSVNGLELHFVPAGWALPTYLWHGYRQYTCARIVERFGTGQTVVTPLGGLFSCVLHFVMITLGEMILRIKTRERLPNFWSRMLNLSLHFDKYAPICATMHVVCRKRPYG